MRAIKDSTATAVNMMVGMSITTAEPTLVLKKVMVASQPLMEPTMESTYTYSKTLSYHSSSAAFPAFVL